MTAKNDAAVTMLGLGAMGRALATAVAGTGRPTTVWNRTPGKAGDAVARGATEATTVEEALGTDSVVVACLLDHASVHEVLDPVAASLTGRTLINLTTTTPNQARELADWAREHGIVYLDGGIMAVPAMIGGPGSAILYSGSNPAFEQHRPLFDLWGTSTYFGTDAGMASLYDMAILSGMYVMFAGFMHGAAMVGSEGVPADTFAKFATPFLSAMTASFDGIAAVLDGGDYSIEGQQSLEFSDLSDFLRAAAEQGVATDVLQPVQTLIERQITAGHGKESFYRIYEGIRSKR